VEERVADPARAAHRLAEGVAGLLVPPELEQHVAEGAEHPRRRGPVVARLRDELERGPVLGHGVAEGATADQLVTALAVVADAPVQQDPDLRHGPLLRSVG
jgi:hypothetical protein